MVRINIDIHKILGCADMYLIEISNHFSHFENLVASELKINNYQVKNSKFNISQT